jgi:GNAT superfamily N-acetyltransferase
MRWIAENPPRWDAAKARIIGGAPAGVFDTRLTSADEGALLPGDWWRVEDDAGRAVGYGWMDVWWGDAEILLATDPDRRREGIGTFILEQLEHEARRKGHRYLTNLVRPTHPDADAVSRWLQERGFAPSEDGRLLRAAARD